MYNNEKIKCLINIMLNHINYIKYRPRWHFPLVAIKLYKKKMTPFIMNVCKTNFKNTTFVVGYQNKNWEGIVEGTK